MNLVERKRRLNTEAMANAGANQSGAAGLFDDNEDTDGVESEEVDIFTRKEKFEKLLARFEKHKEENKDLKGNDLRYNVYLKKLNKMTRMDMGLDLAAYKDYVNNLQEFSRINKDIGIFAQDSMAHEADFNSEQRRMLKAEADFKNEDNDPTKDIAIVNSIVFTVRKLLRSSTGYLNHRDTLAAEALMTDMHKWCMHSPHLLHLIKRLHKKRLDDRKDEAAIDDATLHIENVDQAVCNKAGVSLNDLKKLKILLKVDKLMFVRDEKKIHATHFKANPYDAFIDFTRLPEDMPKEAKDILYRPAQMKKLHESYRKLVKTMDDQKAERDLAEWDNKQTIGKKLRW